MHAYNGPEFGSTYARRRRSGARDSGGDKRTYKQLLSAAEMPFGRTHITRRPDFITKRRRRHLFL